MKNKMMTGILTLLLCATAIAPAMADDAGVPQKRFIFRARALGVIPDEKAGLNIPGKLNVGNALVPEVDLTYFFTEHIAGEIIAGTARHQITYNGGQLGDAWILPPTVTLQYHFTPKEKFSPYIGAGLNYSIMYGEDADNGFSDLNVGNGFGYAAQVGFDYWVNDSWGINFDVKKLWLNLDATVNNGAVTADIDLNPWLIGTGVSFRF